MNDRRTVSNPAIASRQGCQSARPCSPVFLLLVSAFQCFSSCLVVPIVSKLLSRRLTNRVGFDLKTSGYFTQTVCPIMTIKPHPDFDEIKQAVATLSKKGKSFSGVCYRCTEPQFAGQIVSGLGGQLHGARWTPKHSFPTVYLCESVEAALQEYLARGRRMKLPDYKSLPMVMAWVKVKVANLLDTTDAEIAGVINSLLEKDKITGARFKTAARLPRRRLAGRSRRFPFPD